MHGIAYLSSATCRISNNDLENILASSRPNNERQSVTGVLLCHDSTFLQYIEGPESNVQAVYEKIKRSKLHHNIIELLNEQIPNREFGGWAMGFAFSPQTVLLELEQAKWGSIEQVLRDETHPTDGVALLLSFLESSQV